MSEFEKINANAKAQMAARRKAAIVQVLCVLGFTFVTMCVITGLVAIGFNSQAFAIILAVVAEIIGTFKIGWIWRDIKF